MSAERAIFFDLDGTLLHYTRDFEDVLSDAIDAVDGDVPDYRSICPCLRSA